MIHVKVIKAEHLTESKKNYSKTKILCFSSSSRDYYCDKFKNREKVNTTHWNGEFDVSLFKASNLSFIIFGSKMLSKGKKKFLGRVDVDVCKLFTEDAVKQIISDPKTIYECKFPIKSSESQNATLTLAFSYKPTVYKQIEFKDISKPTIHFWTSYDPPIEITETEKMPVEIELFQGELINDRQNGEMNIFFTNFNKYTTWQSVGNSSCNLVVPLQNGLTQVHSFKLSRVAGKYEFFLLNVSNYSGNVTLNFVEEKRGKLKKFKDGSYFTIKSGKENVGIIKTISVKVESNKLYCLPIFMFYDKKFVEKTMNFVSFPAVNCDVNLENGIKEHEYSDVFSSKIELFNQIFEKARESIPELKEVNFLRVNALPQMESISLPKTIKDYNIPPTNNIRIYLGGSTTVESQDQQTTANYWKPFFIVYDAKTGKKNQDISDQLVSYTAKDVKFPAGKNAQGLKAHTTLTFNLDKVGTENIIVFGINCRSTLITANPPGFFLISHVDNENDTLLFRENVFPDEKVHYEVCFRFFYYDNEWKIAPIRKFFADSKETYTYVDNLQASNWNIPNDMLCQSNGVINKL